MSNTAVVIQVDFTKKKEKTNDNKTTDLEATNKSSAAARQEAHKKIRDTNNANIVRDLKNRKR